MPGERDRLMADPLHEAAIADDAVGVVVDELLAEALRQDALGERHADRIRQTLAERPGRGLDAGGMTPFRMPRRAAGEVAEAADLRHRYVGIAGQIEERVEQHRAVAGREHEAVTVRPIGMCWIEF